VGSTAKYRGPGKKPSEPFPAATRTGWQAQFHQAIIEFLVGHGSLAREDKDAGRRGYYGVWQDVTGLGLGWEHPCSGGLTTMCAQSEETCEYCGTARPPLASRPENHLKTCGIDFARSSYDDSEWSQFAGTFADDPWPVSRGIDAIVVCSCGQVAGRHWRYTGTHAELLQAITGQ